MNRRQILKYGAFGLGASVFAPGLLRSTSQGASALSDIEQIVIHPAIGIARVGNSPDEWFIGPEAPGPHPVPPGGFKDDAGRIKRQAARFRLYGLDRDGRVVSEVTAADADIRWTVHLANTKASWYEFEIAFDLPGPKGLPPAPMQPAPEPLRSPRRNVSITDRASVTIDPGPRSIGGASANPDGQASEARFDGGLYLGQEIPLGEVRTDEAGRLLVFGGMGDSGPGIPGWTASRFGNNDLWYDDNGDGPVDATVSIAGREIPVTGAWVVVAPPNYAPGIQAVVTMYDVIFEAATQLAPELRPARPSFTRMIYPMFERMVQNQWVNAGFLRDFGWGSPGDFLAPETLRRLASAAPEDKFLRWQVFERFRDPAYLSTEATALPPYYGDQLAIPPGANPRQWMAVLPLQYAWLSQWADGDFDADWPEKGLSFPARIEDLPLAEQPAALDRAALDECLGGPFHPGIEMTWPMRIPHLYEAPFRVRRRLGAEPDWGPEMTSDIALAEDGPLAGSGPGAITRWTGLPWQTDTSSCLSRYVPDVDTYLPAYWPAKVPNEVLDLDSYLTVIDSSLSLEARQQAFGNRVRWLRGLPGLGVSGRTRINAFNRQWGAAGIVTPQPGPDDGAPFPKAFWVELGHALVDDSATAPAIDLPPRPNADDLSWSDDYAAATPVP